MADVIHTNLGPLGDGLLRIPRENPSIRSAPSRPVVGDIRSGPSIDFDWRCFVWQPTNDPDIKLKIDTRGATAECPLQPLLGIRQKLEIGMEVPPAPNPGRFISRADDALQLQVDLHGVPGVDELIASPPIQRRQQQQGRRCGERGHLQVFVQDGSDDLSPRIQTALRNLPEVESVHFVSHRDAHRRFVCFFAHTDVVDSISKDEIPESFDVELKRNADTAALVARIRALPGVDDARRALDAPLDLIS